MCLGSTELARPGPALFHRITRSTAYADHVDLVVHLAAVARRLIDKEWLSFGHMFNNRTYAHHSAVERAPIFVCRGFCGMDVSWSDYWLWQLN